MKTTNFWKNKKVLVTGGTGFIGSHLLEKLLEKESIVTVLDHIKPEKLKHIEHIKQKIRLINGDCDNLQDALKGAEGQDIVMNLAARVGGIEYNRTHQGSILARNLGIGTNVLEAAKQMKVERFLVVSSACVYPHDALVPTPETEGFKNGPEPTNGGYGWAKRVAELLGKYYAEEYGMNIGIVRPYNAYGPRDHFDPEKSHVIPALIRRVFQKENPLLVWGSGKQTRAFLYVEDLAEGMIAAIEKYPVPEPINLGTDEEVSIKELIEKIITISGLKIKVQFDTSKPDGSPRRNSNNSRAMDLLGFKASTSLTDGLKKTIEWYLNENK